MNLDKTTLQFIKDEVTKLQLEDYEKNKNKLEYFRGKNKAFTQVLTIIDQNIPIDNEIKISLKWPKAVR